MNESHFRRMAAEYAERYGAELRRELDDIRQNDAPQITPALDRRVRAGIGALKRRRYTRITGLIAACLAFALLIPSVLRLYETGIRAPEATQNGALPAPAPSPAYEILPLSFALPDNFSVASVEQDIEKTVYYLENSQLDDVVMTMEYSDGAMPFEELTPILINGHNTYGSSGQGYSLLTFENQEILYILTCKHDINTLVNLSKSILI